MTQFNSGAMQFSGQAAPMKRVGLVWLGVILLIAFFMPVVQKTSLSKKSGSGYKVSFPNVKLVTTKMKITVIP